MADAEVEEGRPSRRRAAAVAARAIDAGRCDSADDSDPESVQARRSKVPRAANTAREAHRVSQERAAATRERQRQRKQNIRDAEKTARCAAHGDSGLSVMDIQVWEECVARLLTLMQSWDAGRTHDEFQVPTDMKLHQPGPSGHVYYCGIDVYCKSKTYKCGLCSGSHQDADCVAARNLMSEFDTALSLPLFQDEFRPGAQATLQRLLHVYKVHFCRAFKPQCAGFPDLAHAILALSPLIVESPGQEGKAYMVKKFTVRGSVWISAGGQETWNLDRLATMRLDPVHAPFASPPPKTCQAQNSPSTCTPPTVPRASLESEALDADSTSLQQLLFGGESVKMCGQHSRAKTLKMPYARFHVMAVHDWLARIHEDVCEYELTMEDRFHTGCDSTFTLICTSAEDGHACAFHKKSIRAGTINDGNPCPGNDSDFLTVPMAVLAAMCSGLTCVGLNAVMEEGLGLAGVSGATFAKHEQRWGEAATWVLRDVLKKNIVREALAAFKNGEFGETFDGKWCIVIRVQGDACWCVI